MAYSGTIWRIYVITNMLNNKKYVGLTNNLSKRWNKHYNANGSSPALHSAIQKYGVNNFDFQHYADTFGADSAKTIEINLIAELNTLAPFGYNLTSGGEGSLKPSDELRKKLSIAHTGKKQSEETKKKRSDSLKKAYANGTHKGTKGKKFTLTDEAKNKISVSKSGSNNPMFGKNVSDTRKSEISKQFKGNTFKLGTKASNATKEKMSKAQKLRWEVKKAIEKAKLVKEPA